MTNLRPRDAGADKLCEAKMIDSGRVFRRPSLQRNGGQES
jgi:hypothetical protein